MPYGLHVSIAVIRCVVEGCAIGVAMVLILESTSQLGLHVPMPSAWSLVSVVIAARFGGRSGGLAASALAVGYAIYTDGFTPGPAGVLTTHAPPTGRTLAFTFLAPTLAMLVGSAVTFSSALPASRPCPQPAEGQGLCMGLTLALVTRRVSNDLNNQFMVILGLCELELARRGHSEGEAVAFADIARAAERGAKMLRELQDENLLDPHRYERVRFSA
jgi:hypothetical protein